MSRSNKEGTCLWCGKKLVYFCHTEFENTDKIAPACCPRCDRKPVKGDPDPREFDEDFGHLPGWKCPECEGPVFSRKVRRVASRERIWKKPGYRGTGLFCTLNCAHKFAVAAARNGYRFEPEE